MKPYITAIDRILKNGGRIKDWENLNTLCIMNRVIPDNLRICVDYFKDKLPNEYAYFLKYYDGGILFNYNELGGYELLSSESLIKEDRFQKDNSISIGEKWDDDTILFCRIIGNAEFLGFRLTGVLTYEIKHCVMDMPPDQWLTIGCSFDEFIEKLIQEKGREYWLVDGQILECIFEIGDYFKLKIQKYETLFRFY